MIDFKFRIYTKKNDIKNNMCAVKSLDFSNDEIICEHDYTFKFSEVELMQFTGLKDKNGVEIYKGDIVKFDDGEIAEVVFFCGAFMPKLKKGQCVGIDYDAKPIWQDGEIIGNIHENSELLK